MASFSSTSFDTDVAVAPSPGGGGGGSGSGLSRLPRIPSDDFGDAFEELMDAKAELNGKREFILLDGHKLEALVSEITEDEANISGGVAQAGGFRCQVAVKDLADSPETYAEIEVRGSKRQVLSYVSVNNTVYEIVASDPSNEAR